MVDSSICVVKGRPRVEWRAVERWFDLYRLGFSTEGFSLTQADSRRIEHIPYCVDD